MAISYIGGAQNAGAANPTTGEFTVHANTQAGDLVIAQWYSRASAKTFTNTDAINILIDQATANGGHLVVGWWIAGSNADSKTWDGSSVSNGTTGWQTATFRGPNTSTPFRYSGSVAGGSNQIPNMPSISTGSGDTLVGGFGGMDDYGTVSEPALFTTAGTWEQTLGTDASAGMSYDLDGGTGSAVDPAAYGTTFTAATYWYAWTGSLDPSVAPTPVSQTLTPVYDVRNVVAQVLGGAGGGTFGDQSTATCSLARGADQQNALRKATLSETGLVSSISLYLGLVAGTQVMKAVIWAADGAVGAPGTLKAVSEERSLTGAAADQWYTFNITSPVTLPPGDYWLGGTFGTTAYIIKTFRVAAGANSMYYRALAYASSPSDPYGASTGWEANVYGGIYATYTAAAPVSYDIRSLAAQTLAPVYDIQQSLTAVSQTLTPIYSVIQHVAGSLSPTYNVRQLAAQTLTPAYALRQLAATTLTPQYNLRQAVAQSLTPVYGVVQHVSATLTPEYDILEPLTAVSQTLTPTYNVRQLAAQNLTPAYSVRSLVHQTLTPAYSVIQHVAQTLTAGYNVTQLATQTLAPTYNVIQHIAATLTPTYGVRQGVNQTLTPVYSVRSLTSQTLTPGYDLRAVVARTIEPTYGVRQSVSQTITPGYGIIQHVAQNIAPAYDLIQHVSTTLEPMYDVLEAGLTQVSQTLTPTYDLVQHMPQTLAATYGIRVLVAQALQPGYNVRTLAAGTLTPVYSVRASVSASMTPGYDLRELAGAVLTPTYDVAQFAAATLSPSYDILADLSAVDQTLEALYDLRELAVQTLTPVYGVREHAGQTLTVSYHILGYSKYDHAIVAPRRWPFSAVRRARPRAVTPAAPGKWYRRAR